MNKKLTLLFRFVGIAIFIGILLSIDLGKSLELLAGIHLPIFLYGLLLLIPLFLLRALRWKYLLQIQGIDYPLLSTLLVCQSSNFIGFVTPGRIGESTKLLYLKNDLDISLARSMPTVILDRLFDVYTLLGFGLFGLYRYSLMDRIGAGGFVFLSVIMLLPLLFFIDRLALPLMKAVFSLPLLKRFRERILTFLASFYHETRSLLNLKLINGLAITVLTYLILFYMCQLLAQSAGILLDYITVAFFVAVVNVLSYLPITVSGIGTRDAGLILLFNQVDKSSEQAVIFSTLIFFCFYLMGGLSGYVCYNIKPIRLDNILKSGKSFRSSRWSGSVEESQQSSQSSNSSK